MTALATPGFFGTEDRQVAFLGSVQATSKWEAGGRVVLASGCQEIRQDAVVPALAAADAAVGVHVVVDWAGFLAEAVVDAGSCTVGLQLTFRAENAGSVSRHAGEGRRHHLQVIGTAHARPGPANLIHHADRLDLAIHFGADKLTIILL